MNSFYKYRNYIIFILVTLVFTLYAVYVYLENKLATSGEILSVELEEMKQLKTANTLLQEQLYTYSSLRVIAEEAKRMGFVDAKPNNYLYIKP